MGEGARGTEPHTTSIFSSTSFLSLSSVPVSSKELVSTVVTLQPPGTLPRSEGKAQRIVDRRTL